MPIFIIEKRELENDPELRKTAGTLCESVLETESHFEFIPRPGSLVSFSLLLSQRGVVYEVYFDNDQGA